MLRDINEYIQKTSNDNYYVIYFCILKIEDYKISYRSLIAGIIKKSLELTSWSYKLLQKILVRIELEFNSAYANSTCSRAVLPII